jgi:hypothetical protein
MLVVEWFHPEILRLNTFNSILISTIRRSRQMITTQAAQADRHLTPLTKRIPKTSKNVTRLM